MTAVLNLDLRQTQADTGADPIPAGWYLAMIDESSLAGTSKDPNNKMLKLRFNILEGQFAGRKVFTNFNIIHSNVMTQEIAQKQLKAVCVAVGHHGMLADSGELHAKPCRIKVKVRKATDEYEASNDITTYLPKDAPLPAGAGPTAVTQAAAAAAPAGVPSFAAQPWAANAAPVAAMPPATTGAPVFPVAAPAAAAATAAPALPWASAPATATPEPVAAPVAAPVAPVPQAAPAQAPTPIKRMTEKAAGATYEQFIGNNWTDEGMIRDGYMVLEMPAAPVPAAAPAPAPVPVAAPVTQTAAVAAPAGTPMAPPWATPAA